MFNPCKNCQYKHPATCESCEYTMYKKYSQIQYLAHRPCLVCPKYLHDTCEGESLCKDFLNSEKDIIEMIQDEIRFFDTGRFRP